MPLPKIEAPKYEAKIPSTGKTIQYRPYLVKEEKILMIALETKNSNSILNAVKDIISSCTYGKVDPENLCTFDLEYLFLKLRAKSTGEIAKIGMKCSHCEAVNQLEVNLDQIEVKMPEGVDRRIALTDVIGVNLTWPKMSRLPQNTGEKADANAAMDVVIACIDSIYDKTKIYKAEDTSREEMIEFIESLSQAQFGKIQDFMLKMPALETKVQFNCVKCKKDSDIALSGLNSFFT